MAIDNVKKVIVQKSQLPPLNSNLQKYVVRYRIISEDRNRISHWSPQYLVSPIALQAESLATATISNIGDSIVVSWDTSSNAEVPAVDIFVAWGSSPGSVGLYSYHATLAGNTTTIPVPAGSQAVNVKVQLTTYPVKLLASRVIADSLVVNLV